MHSTADSFSRLQSELFFWGGGGIRLAADPKIASRRGRSFSLYLFVKLQAKLPTAAETFL